MNVIDITVSLATEKESDEIRENLVILCELARDFLAYIEVGALGCAERDMNEMNARMESFLRAAKRRNAEALAKS